MVNEKFLILDALKEILHEQHIRSDLLYTWFAMKYYLLKDEVDVIKSSVTNREQINVFCDMMKSKPDSIFVAFKELANEHKWEKVLIHIESQLKELSFYVLSNNVSNTHITENYQVLENKGFCKDDCFRIETFFKSKMEEKRSISQPEENKIETNGQELNVSNLKKKFKHLLLVGIREFVHLDYKRQLYSKSDDSETKRKKAEVKGYASILKDIMAMYNTPEKYGLPFYSVSGQPLCASFIIFGVDYRESSKPQFKAYPIDHSDQTRGYIDENSLHDQIIHRFTYVVPTTYYEIDLVKSDLAELRTHSTKFDWIKEGRYGLLEIIHDKTKGPVFAKLVTDRRPGKSTKNEMANKLYIRQQAQTMLVVENSNFEKECYSKFNTHNTGEKPFLFGIKKPTACFTGREATIEKIHKIIMQNCPLPNSQRVVNCLVFSGLGGIGKSQLVLFYIQKYRSEFDSIILINSESEASLKSSIFNLASDLGISSEGLMFEMVAKHVTKMIENIGRKNLLVFDSADEINPTQILLKEFVNIFGLITSRHKKWYNNEELVAVEALTEEEAINFVFKSLQDRNLENDGITEFVSALQCFPLAIRQAVSYIKMKTGIYTKFTFRNYLEELKSNIDNAKKLLSYRLEKNMENDYQLVTLNTWQITFNQIRFAQQENKSYEKSDESNKPESMSSVILNVCAYLSCDNIPVKIFFNEANRDEERLTLAIDVLNSYSLISVSGALLKVHKLVQQVTRLNLLDEGTSEKYVIKASQLLYETYDIDVDCSESMLNKRALIPHLLDLKMHIEYLEKHLLINMENCFKMYCNLLKCIQHFYFLTREPQIGKQVSENLLMLLEKHYGPQHLEVCKCLSNLANFYILMGDPETMKTLLERALKIQELHYDADHFEMAITLGNLANAYGALGNPQTMKAMLERVLKIDELHYGADHFKMAITLGNLANAYGDLGDPQTMKAMLERALKIQEVHYGADHFEVARTLGNLANAYGNLGDPQTKKTMLERALKIKELHYGANHFEVAITLGNLANAYGDLGDPQTMKAMLERALKIQALHYGADHFEVARTLVNLANAYGDLGDPQTKKTMLKRALKIKELHYGTDHFEVAITLGNLANAYGNLGDPQTKKTMLERALKIKQLHYGADHFEVARMLVNLANAYGDLGDPQTMKVMLERALKIQALHYGADHFEVARTLVNLANAYGDLGDPQTKKTMLKRALKIKELHYGTDHFEVAITLGNLANAYGNLGDPQTKKTMLERALKIQELHYGANHFEVSRTLINLATAYGALGDPQTKKTMLERALKIKELHYGADHFEVARPLLNLATVYGDLGDLQTKKAMLERALKIQELHYGADHFEVARTLLNLATAYGDLGDLQTKKAMLKRALKIQELYYGPDHFEVAITLRCLGGVYGDLGDLKTKKVLLESALTIQELHYGLNNYQVAITICHLAYCYVDLKNYQKAKDLLENVFEIFVNHYGRNHDWTNRVAAKLDEYKNCAYSEKEIV